MAFLTPDLEAFTKDVKAIFTTLFPQKKVRSTPRLFFLHVADCCWNQLSVIRINQSSEGDEVTALTEITAHACRKHLHYGTID